jgi:hypothetical protein
VLCWSCQVFHLAHGGCCVGEVDDFISHTGGVVLGGLVVSYRTRGVFSYFNKNYRMTISVVS